MTFDEALAKIESLRKALLQYGKRSHYYCDDAFYSCPKAEGGCVDERVPQGVCNCGADKHNETVLKVLE